MAENKNNWILLLLLGLIAYIWWKWSNRCTGHYDNQGNCIPQGSMEGQDDGGDTGTGTSSSGSSGGQLPDQTGETFTGETGGNTPTGFSSSSSSGSNPSLPDDPNWCLGGAPMGNGVCGSTGRLANPNIVILEDPRNPNSLPTLYEEDNVINPVNPMSDTTLDIGVCNNALNTNSNYISILTGSPMNTTSIMQFLDNMRKGYLGQLGANQTGGCKFLKARKQHHVGELAISTNSVGYIQSPNHRAIKQAKVNFLTATIDNCCTTETIINAEGDIETLNIAR